MANVCAVANTAPTHWIRRGQPNASAEALLCPGCARCVVQYTHLPVLYRRTPAIWDVCTTCVVVHMGCPVQRCHTSVLFVTCLRYAKSGTDVWRAVVPGGLGTLAAHGVNWTADKITR
eukprot:1682645-Rhodomonas_salina.1